MLCLGFGRVSHTLPSPQLRLAQIQASKQPLTVAHGEKAAKAKPEWVFPKAAQADYPHLENRIKNTDDKATW